jgi:hypothetical protein
VISIAQALPQYSVEEIMDWPAAKLNAMLWALEEHAKARKPS